MICLVFRKASNLKFVLSADATRSRCVYDEEIHGNRRDMIIVSISACEGNQQRIQYNNALGALYAGDRTRPMLREGSSLVTTSRKRQRPDSTESRGSLLLRDVDAKLAGLAAALNHSTSTSSREPGAALGSECGCSFDAWNCGLNCNNLYLLVLNGFANFYRRPVSARAPAPSRRGGSVPQPQRWPCLQAGPPRSRWPPR